MNRPEVDIDQSVVESKRHKEINTPEKLALALGYVKLPKEKAGAFQANFAAIPPQERLKFLVHKVKKGETPSLIAKKYGTSIDSIMYLNKLKNAKYLKVGIEIVIPVRPKKMAAPVTASSNPRG